MRRLLLLILCLSSIWTAQGQVAYDWRYWFDQSPTYEQGSSEGTLHLDVDVSGLSKSLHQIHIQVRDTAGMFSEPVSKYFVVPDDGHGSSKLHYWFDQNNADLQVVDLGNGMFDLDVSHLNYGFHTLHFQVSDVLGIVSNPQNKMFYIPEKSDGKNKLYYWVDENSQTLTTTEIQDSMTLDFSYLESGYHTLHFIATDKYGATSEPMHRGFIRATNGESLKWRYWFDDEVDKSVVMPPTTTSLMIDVDSLADGLHYIHLQAMNEHFSETKTQMFVKVPKTMNMDEVYCLVLIDNMLHSKETINMKNGGMATMNLDVKDLSQGLHKLDVMVMTPSGALSTAYNSYFVRGYLGDDRGALRCLYAFDDEADVHETTYSEGMSHLNIDVAHLTDGPHTVRWMLADKEGAYVSDKHSWFIKIPLGGNAISKYSYWLNDADSVKHVKVLDEPKNPYDLIALLPVESMPLRSSSFHFENKDNQPMMYAKNDIHFTFTDRFDRETNISKQYVDYNVSEAVTDIEDLKYTQTFARVEENCIKWFKFEAEEGDTIAFKASQATSVQVFAPNGEEIYSASGDKSVKYGGAHTWEDGTYYVAIHDVTGTKPNVTLDYFHMDRYDVVAQDVRVVGNGGCSTITFQGNGFRDLYAVDLKDSRGNIIQSIDIGHESDASTTVTFDFTGAELGKYNAVFHFTEEDKTITNCITVEEAKEIELATTVTFPSTFLRGTSTAYTVTITNKGNMTAYAVPLYVWIQSNTKEGVKRIDIKGLELKKLVDFVDRDSCTNEVYSAIEEISNKLSDDHYFMKFKNANPNNPNDSVVIRSSYFTTQLSPNESKTIQFIITSNEVIQAYFTIPTDWYSVYNDSKTNRQMARFRNESAMSTYCCYRERVECVANIAVDVLDFASLLGIGGPAVGLTDCIVGGLSQMLSAAGDVACGKNDVGSDLAKKANSVAKGMSVAGSLLSCASGYNKLKEISQILSAIVQTGDMILYPKVAVDCINAFREKKPNCPPVPPNGGGSSPVNSYDPNEIYGYIAPSGSMFVGDEVVNLPYRIEFENDTTFATSAAHKVVVKDTLDAKVFDLSSYQPTSIRIGDKNVYLNGDKEFVTTVDMRPAINTIAQVEGQYDEKSGIATWQFTSLDPMTMEPTDDIMQGFLPVNYDGSGIGEVAYIINRKTGLPDGTEISNKASIIFDNNDAIETPVWTNIIDAVPPVTHVSEVEQVNDTTMLIRFDGEDNRSGLWKYALYVQYGEETAWFQVAETDTTCVEFRYVEDVDYGFCVVATDSAGNVEQKIIRREYSFLNGEGKLIDNISSPRKNQVATNRAYDLNGRLIQEEGYRGIIIKNRKKILKR